MRLPFGMTWRYREAYVLAWDRQIAVWFTGITTQGGRMFGLFTRIASLDVAPYSKPESWTILQ